MQAVKLHRINTNETPVSDKGNRIGVVHIAIGNNWQHIYHPSSFDEITKIQKEYIDKYSKDEVKFLIQNYFL